MIKELPKIPKGWKRNLLVHLNFGGGKGAASYAVFDAEGKPTPIGYQYNTKEKISGFSLPDVEPLMTWEELRQIWPTWLEKHQEKT